MNECKGLVYRGKLQVFINVYGGYERHETMVPVSTQSCPGCDDCLATKTDLVSFIESEIFPTTEDFQDAALYRLEYVYESMGVKTVVRRSEEDFDLSADEYEPEFVRIKNG